MASPPFPAINREETMTEDEQEVESLRYADAIKVLPLSGGRIAMLGPRNELYKIVDNWAEVLHNIESLRTAFRYVPTKPAALVLPSINIDVDL